MRARFERASLTMNASRRSHSTDLSDMAAEFDFASAYERYTRPAGQCGDLHISG